MQIVRDYEISIWEQKGKEEIKIGVIGSNEMTSPGRAQKPVLTRNTNGTKKLEFYLFFEYVDEIEGTIRRNPYCALLSNGRKIKLKWKNKWYEFVITNITESSEDKKITYIAQDAYITELSRKGFNIELSTDLENNQGTIFYLTDKILENTDWQLDEENSLVGPQTLDEVLIELEVTNELFPTQKTFLDSNGLLTVESLNGLKIPKGAKIYSFYSLVNNEDSYFQFYYLENENYQFNEDGFIYNCPLYIYEGCRYSDNTPIGTKKLQVISSKGKKLIRSQKSEYNKVLDTYVKVYEGEDGGENSEILGYNKTEYFTDDFVTNLVTNDKDYITDIGWYTLYDDILMNVYNYPEPEVALELLETQKEITTYSFLQINTPLLNTWAFYNTGPNDNKEALGNLYEGKQFVIKLKYRYNKSKMIIASLKNPPYDKNRKKLKAGFTVDLCAFDYDEDGRIKISDAEILASTSLDGENSFSKDGQYWTAICKTYANYTKEELREKNLGLFFKYSDSEALRLNSTEMPGYYFYIEDCQFFEYKEKFDEENEEPTYYVPGEIINSEAKIKYSYFLRNQEYDSEQQIKYLYSGYKQQNYPKKYYEDFPQIKTVEGKESNVFNLIQTLCEKFDCWADFVVDHDENGYIKKDKKGKPIKKVCYRPYIGRENWSGYRRGINLKKVNRVLDSTQITTKTIVKPNTNEFAPSGFCTIAYSKENPCGENFIYDFSHYISKGLIDPYTLHNDLYGTNGLYAKLRKLNEENQILTDNRVTIANSLVYNEKEKEVYSALVSELNSSVAEAKRDFRLYTGITYQNFLRLDEDNKKEILTKSGANDTFVRILSETSQLRKAAKEFNTYKEKYKEDVRLYNEAVDKIKENAKEKEKLILNFESKYSNFIQEGVWISEDCIDHDLYYIEAKSIATTSSIPKISYTIDVIDISSLEEFFNYNVDIGDKTYIIDPEFFGYLNEFEKKTPKKQEVVITELMEDLENPENNKTTVQSYKTQFDDLFSRITATAQQLQLNEGAYNRAAGAFSNYGLDSTYTQNSLNNSNFLLQNNTIKWNVDGFVSTNNINKHQYIKIHNGSIYLTNDGGATWNAAIGGKGINANYIYAGQLDAGKINIVSELKTTEDQELEYCLTMDKLGLSMYSFQDNEKVTRLRLGRVVSEDEQIEEDLYGLQLYNNQGVQTFRTDSNGDITMAGTIYAKDGYFKGMVVASKGEIGGWVIDQNQLYHKTNDEIDAIISTSELSQTYQVNGKITADWRLLFGLKNNIGNFGVTESGNLYANGVDIKDGNINFGDLFKITSNGTGSAVSYGLNIELSSENKNEAVVIESEKRVIGIREKQMNNEVPVVDESGRQVWTWKTIIGDLTNVTLGSGENRVSMNDLGIKGYGICTDNGFFSGCIVAGAGQIGGFIINDNKLYTNNFENNKIVNDWQRYQEEQPTEEQINLLAETSEILKPLSEENALGVYLDGLNGGVAFRNDNGDYFQFNSNGLNIKASEIITNNSTITIRDGFTITDKGIYISAKDTTDADIAINEINENGMKITKGEETVFEITKNFIKGENGEFSQSLSINNYFFGNYKDVQGKTRMGCFLR